jgi:hypothetical protein
MKDFLKSTPLALDMCVAIVFLAGCGGQTGTPGTMPQGAMSSGNAAHDGSLMKPGASGSDPWLYVGGSNSVVNVYDVAQAGNPLVLSITQGVANPVGLKVDNQGTLYVTNGGNETVAEYSFGQNVPTATLSVNSPVDTAIDPRTGNLYVDTRAKPPGIFVYKKGQTRPSRYILSRLFVYPCQMFFDSSGMLYRRQSDRSVCD